MNRYILTKMVAIYKEKLIFLTGKLTLIIFLIIELECIYEQDSLNSRINRCLCRIGDARLPV